MFRSAKTFLSRFSIVIAALVVACTADRRVAGPTFSLEDCDIEPEGPAMEGESLPCMLDDADPSAPGLFTTWSEEMCVYPSPFNDADSDGVEDSCERATAAAFAPMLIFSSHDCSWDHGLGRMGGEYFYAVGAKVKTDPSTQTQYYVLRVAYLPAYYWDCGTASSVEFVEWFDNPHSGDSEFMLIDVAYDEQSHHWLLDAVFLSAHCGAAFLGISLDQNCKWYPPYAFTQWVDGRSLGAPWVWVSMNKHANYPTQQQCDGAAAGLEDCVFDTPMRFPASYVQQNIGSRAYPFRDCEGPFSSSSMADDSEVECMWSYHPGASSGSHGRFNGWQTSEVGHPPATYGKLLQQHAAF